MQDGIGMKNVALKAHYQRLRQQNELVRHMHDLMDTSMKHERNDPFKHFKQYCTSFECLLRRGTSHQHFQYLFTQYAVSEPGGITRAELLTLFQDHVAESATSDDPRYFEKVYTWLKRHFTSAFKSYDEVIALLSTHPNILERVRINLDRLATKMEANAPISKLPDDLMELFD